MDSDDDLDPDLNQAVLESLCSQDLPEQDISDVEQETSLPETPTCESLVSLAAKVTGKHYPCVALETHDVINAEHVMKKILFWTFPQSEQKMKMIATLNDDEHIWTSGENMANCVEDIHQVGFSISGIVKKDEKSDKSTESARVSLTFEKQTVTSTSCSVCPRILWCRHIVAIALYRIRNPEKVPIHLPVMDVLSSLSRHQLQKVMQYAIYDDPGGLIPRLFKYINDVRNPDSDLNQIDGLPDPSFGMDPDRKCTVDLSMETLQENLVSVVQEMRWSSDKYPPSFDYVEKRNKSFYQQYFGKIKVLVENEETEIAGKLLMSLASTTFDEINNLNPPPSYSCLKWLVQDIERFFSCFIISCKGPIREKLIEKSLELNRIANGMDLDFFLKTSEWVMPKLRNPSVKDILGAFPCAPFYQPLCASFVLDGPSPFQDIVNGRQTNLLALVYEEPLAVMMLRFDSLLLLGHQNAEKKICKLGIVILRRLLKLTSELTIVSPGPIMPSVSEKKNVSKEMIDDTEPSSPKRQRLMDETVGSDDQDDNPEIDDNEWQSLSKECQRCKGFKLKPRKANVSYCLLYICYALYRIPNMVEFCDLGLSVVMNATLRALEMGRYRGFAPEDSLSPKEYSWLTRMENTIVEKFAVLQSSGNQNLQLQQMFACQMYSSALQEKGVAFYGNHLALKLIKTLIQHDSVVDPDMKLRLYVDTLCASSEPFMNLKIPETTHDPKNKSDLKDVYGFFFEKLFDDSSEKQKSAKKVLQHLEESKDIEFIEMGIKVLKKHMTSLNNDFKLYALRIVVHGIQQYTKAGDDKYNMSKSDIFDITKEVEKDIHINDYLTLLLSAWEDVAKFFREHQVLNLATIIGDRIKVERENLSPESFLGFHNFLTAKYKHNEEVCSILQGLTEDKRRHAACRVILENHENYSPVALLKVAKMEHEIQSADNIVEEEREVTADIFSKDVYGLCVRALDGEKLKNESDSENDSPIALCHLEWCFSALANCTTICEQFSVIAEKLSICGTSPDVLVDLLNKIAESPSLSDHAKSLFGDRLVSSYYIEFEGRLKNYDGPSSYDSILRDMSTARKNCIKFVDNGGPLFQTKVVVPIRRRHKGKKKFLRMMNTDFKDILEETDN